MCTNAITVIALFYQIDTKKPSVHSVHLCIPRHNFSVCMVWSVKAPCPNWPKRRSDWAAAVRRSFSLLFLITPFSDEIIRLGKWREEKMTQEVFLLWFTQGQQSPCFRHAIGSLLIHKANLQVGECRHTWRALKVWLDIEFYAAEAKFKYYKEHWD